MKKLLAVVLVLMIAVMCMTGCSEHQSEIAKDQAKQEAALDEYLKSEENETSSLKEKMEEYDGEPSVVVSVYSLADGNKGLVMNMEDVPEMDDWELTEKLKAYKVLPETAEVINIEPDKGLLEYTGVASLTPRQAQAIINTFAENYEITGQMTLALDGKDIMVSGYNADFENIDDTYAGGADDGYASQEGPGFSK